MALPSLAGAKPSRWGSFLTGLESRLDTILADEDVSSKNKTDGSKNESAENKAMAEAPEAEKTRGNSPARTSSTNRAQERLNERLAKAMVNRNNIKAADISTTTSNIPSRTTSPANVISSPRPSSELRREGAETPDPVAPEMSNLEHGAKSDSLLEQTVTPAVQSPKSVSIEPQSARLSMESHTSFSTRSSLDRDQEIANNIDLPQVNGHTVQADWRVPGSHENTVNQLRSDYEAAELRRQEETHDFLERIDALQSKLQHLTKEAAEAARMAAANAETGSDAQKLAAKDEKIAHLMAEGQKLSQTELKHMSIIKKLRAKSAEDEKALAESKRQVEKHEKAARGAQEKAKRAEAAERQATERTRILPKLEKDIENLRSERNARATMIESLHKQVSEARAAAQEVEGKVNAEALESEKKRTSDLKDELSKLKLEQEVSEKAYMTEVRALREKAERDKESARLAEIERQGEQNILESRLEALRARAEEASAGSTGDVQAKLLRQIETLQNQVNTLEKERDEISKREADVRRKAREMNFKSRRLEEDLERATARLQDVQHDLSQRNAQITSLRENLSRAEAKVMEARKDLQAEREKYELHETQRLEEEKARQRDELARAPDAPYHHFGTESPVISQRTRKSSNPDRYSPHGRLYHGLHVSGSVPERPISRRSSTQPLRSAEIRPSSRQDSTTFTHHSLTNGTVSETPSITVDYQDDFFDGLQTSASPEHTINDMISASTAAAGPSVQLVERMSAAVRRLESEKAASKDELARLSQQRDEAREQVVSLMREAEDKRKADERINALEKQNELVQERYSTTLEMLGEKSEKVEELKADVADLKQMYRDLVDSTMR